MSTWRSSWRGSISSSGRMRTGRRRCSRRSAFSFGCNRRASAGWRTRCSMGAAVSLWMDSSASDTCSFTSARSAKSWRWIRSCRAPLHEYLQIGRVMWFSNADIELMRGGADLRRRFLDFVCVQREPAYRTLLREYERALRSRNLLLKQPSPRWREIAAFDQPLISAGSAITAARGRLCEELRQPANEAHRVISEAREDLRIEYVQGAGERLCGGARCGAERRRALTPDHRRPASR